MAASDFTVKIAANGALQFAQEVKGAGPAVGDLGSASDRAAQASERLSAAVGRVGHYASLAGAAALVSQNLRGMVGRADEFANMTGRLSVVSESTAKAAATQAKLFDMAQQVRVGVAGLSDTYVKLKQSTEGLGFSEDRLLGITKTLGQAMALSGGSAESMKAALVQLGQGMASGTLRGEELNSILEQTPALAHAIAEGMGRTVGELRDMGKEGKITSQVLAQALEASAQKVESDFNRLPLTVGQAMTQLQNAMLQSTGVFDQANGLSRGLAESISFLSRHMEWLTAATMLAAGVVGGRLVSSYAASVAASMANTAATQAGLRSTVAATEARAIYTATVLAESRANLYSATGFGASMAAQRAATAASIQHTAALAAQTVAQQTLNTVTSFGARALLLLGGPVGAVGTAVGLGAAAWTLWGNSSKDATDKAAGAVQTSGPQIIDQLEKENAALERKIRLLRGAGVSLTEATPGEQERNRALERYYELLNQRVGTEAEEITRRELLRRATLEVGRAYTAVAEAQNLKAEADRLGGKWEQELLDIRMKLAGVSQDYIKTLKSLADASAADPARAAEYADIIRRVIDQQNNGAQKLIDIYSKLAEAGRLRNAEDSAALELGRKLAGGEKDYVEVLSAVRDRKIKIADLQRAGLLDQLRENVAVAQSLERRKEEAAFLADHAKAQDKARESLAKHTAGIDEQTMRQLEANVGMRLGEEALKRLEISKIKDAEATALRNEVLERGLDGAARLADEWARQAQALDRLAQAKAGGVSAAAAKKARDDWQSAADSIEQSLTDALMRGFESGRGFAESLKSTLLSTFKTMVLKPIIQAQVKWAMGGALQQGGRTGGGGVGLFGSAADYVAAYSGKAYGTDRGSEQSRMLAEQDAGIDAGSAIAGVAPMLASVSPVLGAIAAFAPLIIAAGKLAMKDQAKGFNESAAREAGDGFGGKYGAGTIFANDARLLKKLGVNEKWADIMSLSTGFSKLFGFAAPTIKAQGISGQFGAGVFSGSSFADVKRDGGLFRSDKNWTDTKAMDAKLQRGMDEASKGLLDKTSAYAKSLGLPVAALARATSDARIELGADEAANQKAIDKALGSYGDTLSKTYEQQLKNFARPWETLAETLQRLSELQVFSDNLNALGGVFSRVAVLGVDARESMVQLAGGMEAFKAQALGFVQNYYNRDEIATGKAREVRDALSSAGITADISTRDQFRGLVEGTDVSTAAGRGQLAALLSAQGQFAQLTDYLAETGNTLGSAADKAPAMDLLGSLFSSGANAQVDATNGVRDSVDKVADGVQELIRMVGAPRGGDMYNAQEIFQP